MCALLYVLLHDDGIQTEGPCGGLNEMTSIVSGICVFGLQLVEFPVSMAFWEEICHWGVDSEVSKDSCHFEFTLSASRLQFEM